MRIIRREHIRWLAASACLWICCAGRDHRLQAEERVPDVATLEAAVVNARRDISSVELIEKDEFSQKSSRGEIVRRSVKHIWCDGNSLRVDETHEPSAAGAVPPKPGSTQVKCRGCYSDTTVFEISDLPVQAGMERSAEIHDVDFKAAQAAGKIVRLPVPASPLLIGFCPLGLSGIDDQMPLNEYVGRKERSDVRIARDDIGGRRCWRITYRKKNKAFDSEVSIHVAADEGHATARLSESFQAGGIQHTHRVEIANAQITGTGHWFPSAIKYERREGDTVRIRESAQLQVVSLNDARIRESISLSRIPQLQEGTVVHLRTAQAPPDFPNRKAVWSNGRLVAQ